MHITLASLSVVPLSRQNLKEAIALTERVFPFDLESPEAPSGMYTASLDPNAYRAQLTKAGVSSLNYWVVPYEGKLIAFTGLYQVVGGPEDESWLGWYGVLPDARGHGIGRWLLDWTIRKAKLAGCRTFKLYTSNSPDEATAQKLYEKIGLKLVREEPHGEYIYMYREKAL